MNAIAPGLLVALAVAACLASGLRAVGDSSDALASARLLHLPEPVMAFRLRMRRVATRFSARRRFHRTLPRFVEGVARELRGGAPMRAAMLEGAHAAGGPFRADASRLAARLDAGQTVAEVLRWWAADRRAPELARLALVAEAGTRVGGELARALDGVAAAMTDQRDVAAEARSLSSQARASAVLLVVAPWLVAVVMSGVEPAAVEFLLGTTLGWVTIATTLALDLAGAWWMYRLTERIR